MFIVYSVQLSSWHSCLFNLFVASIAISWLIDPLWSNGPRLYRMKIGIWLVQHCMTTRSQTVWHYKPITLTWFVAAVLFLFWESQSSLGLFINLCCAPKSFTSMTCGDLSWLDWLFQVSHVSANEWICFDNSCTVF